ncbi:RES domain-containing protein [Candidimonas sp. SYP-B2681]|uniref:RES family NAD+ phosphorylase n=1 Tax=Candidimonas sp. SYP-B2681 TaxID=2497686 RepID=UPI000F8868EE|nr:RES family NAD+ phosphorylase [Candidimonas sp. SYP-B2681]RTZ47984.1 RES domain-containing protein [Candidimonas sp. SYP-B2681]
MRSPPVSLIRQLDTCRLLPSRFADQEDSVLSPLANNPEHLKDLFDLDNATNQRLAAERGAMPGIGIDELVFGVPNFRMVNAAYAYPRPEGSRFNTGARGAWYCSFDVESALAEVVFHKIVEYSEIDFFNDTVNYQVLMADFSAEFHDLRTAPGFKACLDPVSYVASQRLAVQLLERGSMGIVYPSVRHKGGTNLACFRPALVGNVRRGVAYTLSWSGSPEPAVNLASPLKKKKS